MNQIQDRLVRMGLMDAETGATRRARAVRCPGCRRVVMQGLCADWGGYAVQCDPEPLSALGEALARMSDRATFELRWLGDRYELDRRDHFRIGGTPAGSNGVDVLVRHHCDIPSDSLNHCESVLTDIIESVPLPDKPPF